MGNSFDQSREFVPAGLTDVQASYSFPRRTHTAARSQPKTETTHRPTSPEQQPQAVRPEQARQIEEYLKHLGDRIAYTRGEETSGVAPTGAQTEYGLTR